MEAIKTESPIRVRQDGTRITPRQLRRGLTISTVAGALGNVWVVVIGIPLTMMLECLKASGIMLGMLLSVQQISVVAQVPTALLAERFRSRKPLWVALALTHRALWFLPAALTVIAPVMPIFVGRCVIATVAVSFLLGQMGNGLWYIWMAELVPESMRGRFWGRRQSFVTAAYLAGLALFGFILDAFPDPRQPGGTFTGFAIVFGIGAFFGCVDIVIHAFVPEPRSEPGERGAGVLERVLEPLRDRDFRAFTLSFGTWSFAVGLIAGFSWIYLTRRFGATYTQLSLLVVCASLSTIVFSLIWGMLISRVGPRAFGALMMLLGPFCLVVWFILRDGVVMIPLPFGGEMTLPQPIVAIAIANLLAGALFSGISLAQFNLVAALAPEGGRRAVWIAVHFTTAGLMMAVGPLVGGAIVDYVMAHPLAWRLHTGVEVGFIHVLVTLYAAITWFAALPLLLKVKRQEGDAPFGTVVSRLLVENPLRLAASAYGVAVLATTRAFTRAARELGGRANAMAVSHLIQQIDSPFQNVRAQAIAALGRIGSPEAVNALLKELQEPESGLAPEIALALREARSGRELDILVRKLSAADPAAVVESIRALGAIGDDRAAEPLLGLLKASPDTQVVAASGEALARIGEIAAIWEMLPRMKTSQNPVLKQSLAVAIGDLLGNRKGFDRVLEREVESRGREVERLLKRLARAVFKASRGEMRSGGEAIIRKIHELETAYDEENVGRCADLLFEIAIGISALEFGVEFGGNAEIFMEQLVWRNPRFGVGIWYLDLLNRNWESAGLGKRDWLDVLLGIYFVATHGAEENG